MKYALDAIPIEVLILAFIEFVFVSAFAAVLFFMFGHTERRWLWPYR